MDNEHLRVNFLWPSPEQSEQKLPLGKIGMAIAALILLIIFRPAFHGLVMLIWTTPALILIVLATVGFSVLAYKYGPNDDNGGLAIGAFFGSAFILLVILAIFIGPLQKQAAYQNATYKITNTMPKTKNLRLVPHDVARRYGLDSLQKSTVKPLNFEPVMRDGKMQWVAPLTPDGGYRYFFTQAEGLEVIAAEESVRKVSFINQQLSVADGMGIWDNIRWQIWLKHYFVEVPEITYTLVDGKIVAIAHLVGYQGFLIRYPVYAGCILVWPDGQMQELSPEETYHNQIIKAAGHGYPEWLARYYHQAYEYKDGIWNAWFGHVDQIKIDAVDGELNGQPYYLSTQTGPMWMTAASPYGSSHAVFKILMTDSITGQHQVYSIPAESGWTGAAQVAGYVRSHFPNYTWANNGGTMQAIEPRPEVIHDQLYWVVSITTKDFKAVTHTCLVNAKTNQVFAFDRDEEVQAFIASGRIVDKHEPASNSRQNGDDSRIQRIENLLRQVQQELEQLKKESR